MLVPDGVSSLKVGLGWTTELDLDCSIVLLNNEGTLVDQVFFNQPKSKDGAIIHSGDNRTGEGSGDDETIEVHLAQVDPDIHSIWVVITIYTAG
jgi:tellurium resistance protein TerD